MLARVPTHLLLALLLASAAASPSFARPAHHHWAPAPRAVVAPNGVLLSPADTWREVADAPASPTLGPTPSSGFLGGTFPDVAAARGRQGEARPVVADTGKLEASPPVGPQGTTGGIIPSAQPGWHAEITR